MGKSMLITAGSFVAGGIVATVTIIGLVNSQTSASGRSPADINRPVTINYGTTS